MADVKPVKLRRGFAAMSPEKRRAIAAMGGKAVPAEKRAFSLDRDLASDAGRVGGQAVPSEKRAFSTDPVLAKKAGGKGGKVSGGNFAADPERAVEVGRKGGKAGRKKRKGKKK